MCSNSTGSFYNELDFAYLYLESKSHTNQDRIVFINIFNVAYYYVEHYSIIGVLRA